MNYAETLEYLYTCAPLFQQIGKDAYKEGLENSHLLDVHFGHPHQQFKTIHIAGTNGKGSTSHTLAAVLQAAGYRTGLYTSPHLVDFRERIRVNGTCIPEAYVVDFVARHKAFFEPLHPSFFELTTALAFHYFAEQKVQIAVIEVGLGGRLDCTNIISPVLSLITNISFDHMQFLGNTLEKIATEKAGIIKTATPVLISETTPETRPVFEQKAAEAHAPIRFVEDEKQVASVRMNAEGKPVYQTYLAGELTGELTGNYQLPNTQLTLATIQTLRALGWDIPRTAIQQGFAQVCELTGLKGRWQTLQEHPRMVCDTGHNVAGIRYIVDQLGQQRYRHLHMVIGMVNDKDIRGVLELLPQKARYYFTQASVKRALAAEELAAMARERGLEGEAYPSVKAAVKAAREQAAADDFIFIGGSSFIVADLLFLLQNGHSF